MSLNACNLFLLEVVKGMASVSYIEDTRTWNVFDQHIAALSAEEQPIPKHEKYA